VEEIKKWLFLPEPPEIFRNHLAIFLCAFAIFLLLLHFFGQSRQLMLLNLIAGLVAVLIFIVLYYAPEPIPLTDVVSILVMYGVTLFVVVSDAMLAGLAKFLTTKRGQKWTKEMDYVYLAIGALGILISINRIEFVTGRFEKADIIAPLLLATAVVIRVIKTRAEIGEWNKNK